MDRLLRRLAIAFEQPRPSGRFSLALEVGREKDICKNDSVMERVEASYFSKKKMGTCGSEDRPCIPTDFDAQYLS